MFLIFFLIFVLMFTIFENILIAGISLLLIGVWLVIYQLISKKKILNQKMIYSLLGGFLLAGLVFGIKERRYYWGIQEWQQTIIWTWIVSDISSQGKYTFIYGEADYLLYSKKEYTIGDQIRLVGNMDSGPKNWPTQFCGAGCRNDVHSRYRKISSWTFAVPLFSGSFDYPKWLKMKWRKGTIYETNSIQLKDWSSEFEAVWIIKQMKRGIQQKVIAIYGKNKISGLILWMLIWDKSQIPETEYQNFIDSWLVHLIAVSGGNILMIVVFLQCILIFIPFYPRLGLILLTIIGYSLICGLDSSVFRAVLMGGLSMVALFFGREINIWRVLSISCISMLIINPYFLAYDVGFLLSYSALIGIVYFDSQKKEQKKEQNKIKKWLQYIYKSYISPSIWASIGILPVIIFFMGKINIIGIVWNLLVLPIVPFVMIYGFVSIWLYSWLGWWFLLAIERYLVQYIYKISELLSQYGIFLTVSWLRFKYLIFLIFVCVFLYRKTKKNKVKS